jgi:hypothetical protein
VNVVGLKILYKPMFKKYVMLELLTSNKVSACQTNSKDFHMPAYYINNKYSLLTISNVTITSTRHEYYFIGDEASHQIKEVYSR